MAAFTENLKLEKPDLEDLFDIESFNRNSDIIDRNLNLLNKGITAAQYEFTFSDEETLTGRFFKNTNGTKVPTYIRTFRGITTQGSSGTVDIDTGIKITELIEINGCISGKSDTETRSGNSFKYPINFIDSQSLLGLIPNYTSFNAVLQDSEETGTTLIIVNNDGFSQLPFIIWIEYTKD